MTELVLLPAVDVAGGRAVQLVQGVAGSEQVFGDPRAAAERWQREGAEWIHLVDLDAAFGRGANTEILAEITGAVDVQVELSGGIRDDETLERALATGCARINLGTAAQERPEWCAEVIAAYGDKIAVGLDVRGHRLAARGWTRDGGDLFAALDRLDAAGCARYVVTDVASDGTLRGPNLALLEQVCERTTAPVVASGGISSLSDLVALSGLVGTGVEGAIIGTALYLGRFTLPEALAAVAAAEGRQPVTATDVAAGSASYGAELAPESRGRPLLDGRLRDLLAGKTIVMTGVTGFIGEQLLWKILTELPDTRPAVLVRRKRSAGARERMLGVLKKDIFAGLRDAAGGAEALLDARVEVIEGDLPGVPPLPPGTDIVVHCAGDVSFDPPIDQAFTTNVVGTRALMERMLEACTGPDGGLTTIPHYVHISTAYTAGRRRGYIPEAPHEHTIDWRAETTAGLAMRDLIEAESRTSERLTTLRKRAERQHRAAGYLTTAADTERRRQEWVEAELVLAGTERARSLGWTDVYTFTKALGERVVTEVGAGVRVSVVRPAIVESSWRHPYPGWIEGFKMAEPLILAYGRGELPEFPASPDSLVDIVPCDHVVNAILAVCATEPEIGEPRFYHVSSGARNPLTFRDLYGQIRAYFLDHPFEGGQRGVARLPQWQFPGAASVERLLSTSERAHGLAERVLAAAPRSDRTRGIARDLDRARVRLDFLRRYLSLYNEYAQSELHFVDDNTLALTTALHPEDIDAFAFDTSVYDWPTYVQEVHCPSITAPIRRMDALRRRRGARPSTMKDLSRDTSGPAACAIFDLDGTIMSTNVIEQYLWARLPELSPARRVAELGRVARKLPAYLRAERRDRGTFLRAVYRRYAGADLAALEEFVDRTLAPQILSRLSPEAVRRIREHRDAGHTTILITGVVRPLTRPLAPLFDVIVAADLAADEDGRCTGFLTGPPLVGESRAAWLQHFAAERGLELDRSFAYADSHSDLPLLSAVGHAVAVSPDIALMRAAVANQWSSVEWKIKPITPRWTLPS